MDASIRRLEDAGVTSLSAGEPRKGDDFPRSCRHVPGFFPRFPAAGGGSWLFHHPVKGVFMFKPNMAEMFQQMQRLQQEMTKAQEALGGITAEGSAGGGIVTAVVNGKQQLRSIKIDPEAIASGDKEMLEDLVVAAVNQALEKSQDLAREEMQKVGNGLLPGGLKLPGFGI
jgi:nucleoid-associated protein EbfC